MQKIERIEGYLEELIKKKPELKQGKENIWKAFLEMVNTYENKGKILICGNGGSSADADHIVGELMKGFLLKRSIINQSREALPWVSEEESGMILNQLQYGLPAISLSAHTALITAVSNDINSDLIFAQQVFALGNEGDLFIGLSTSGNSRNVLYAGSVAKAKGMKCIGLTGEKGGRMKESFDISISVPSNSTPEIQEYHLPIYHGLCAWVEEYFFGRD